MVKLNSFSISDEIIKKMENLLQKTSNTGLEHGFNLCNDNNMIVAKDECIGTYCEIKIMHECSNQKKTPKVGDFHTHPRGKPEMSIMDMKRGCLFDFKCIGAAQDDSIKCFSRKKIKNSENCSKEIDDIIKQRELLVKETILLRSRHLEINKLRSLPNAEEFRDLINYNDLKEKRHNEQVFNSIKNIDRIKDKYFEPVIIR